jgi:hypothetical protein
MASGRISLYRGLLILFRCLARWIHHMYCLSVHAGRKRQGTRCRRPARLRLSPRGLGEDTRRWHRHSTTGTAGPGCCFLRHHHRTDRRSGSRRSPRYTDATVCPWYGDTDGGSQTACREDPAWRHRRGPRRLVRLALMKMAMDCAALTGWLGGSEGKWARRMWQSLSGCGGSGTQVVVAD